MEIKKGKTPSLYTLVRDVTLRFNLKIKNKEKTI